MGQFSAGKRGQISAGINKCDVPRASCEDHGVKQLPVAWAEVKGRFTALFEALVISWLKECSISGVAQLLKLSWDEVAGIQDRVSRLTLIRQVFARFSGLHVPLTLSTDSV